MSEEELKSLIKCLHEIWYQNWPENPSLALKLHRHMDELWNYAGITSTLVENNPDKISPQLFKMMTGADE